jgi:hypothetical protein
MKSRTVYLKYALLICLGIVILSILVDLIRISNYKTIPSLPGEEKHSGIFSTYIALTNGEKDIKWDRLNNTLDYINKQYDCSDFRIATLIRMVYDYPNAIPPDIMQKIKNTLLKFRYWMDEPGENGMCYWSENHQILFASAEYLLGQLYPNEIFSNTGLSGKQHMEKARKRILDWLEMRWKFGFSEFYSTVYYNEDIAAIINLIDYSKDEEIAKKSEIIMDLLMYDIASQKTDNMFVSVSGRAYEGGRKGGQELSSCVITNYLWHNIKRESHHIIYGFTTSKKYQLPPALLEIGKDSSNVLIKQCNGLNISQLESEGYFGTDEKSIMMQWGMEAFSNPQIVRNALHYIRKTNMFSNEFLTPMKYLDFTLLRIFYLEPAIIRFVNPQDNGSVMQQANTYTFKTKDYSVYSVQNYFPGNYADQVHVTGMNIKNYFSVFHTHPAVNRNVKSESPSYWVGYGRLPHVAQDSSISLSIYNLPDKKNILEKDMLHFTHAYFPKDKFDTVSIIDNYAFGKKGDTYCALIGRNNFYYQKNTTDDLVQSGKQMFWIIEAGSKDKDGSFEIFCTRVLRNKIAFDSTNLVLNYSSSGKKLSMKYCGDFFVNGSKIKTEYPRFDSPYIKAKYKPDSMDFGHNGKFLHLDFKKMKREFN